MFGLFIMVMVTLALMGAGAAANFYMLAQTQATLEVQKTQVRIQAISDSLRSRFTVVDGQVAFSFDHMEQDVQNRYLARLPNDLIFTRTSSGQPIIFCPAIYRAGSTSNETLAVSDSIQYGVEIKDGYMIAGAPSFRAPNAQDEANTLQIDVAKLNRNGAFGFLIAPNPKSTEENLPNCANIVEYNGPEAQAFLLDGASVSVVFANMSRAVSHTYQVGSKTGLQEGVTYVPSLVDALQLVARNEQASATINVAGPIPGLTLSDLSRIEDFGRGRAITVTASSQAVISSTESNSSLRPSGNWTFNNIDLSAFAIDVGEGQSLTLNSSLVGPIALNGGSVRLTGTSRVIDGGQVSSDAVVMANAGSLVFDVDVQSQPIIGASSSRAAFMVHAGAIVLERDITLASGMVPYAGIAGTSKPVRKIGVSDIYTLTGEGVAQTSGDELVVSRQQSTDTTACDSSDCVRVAECPIDQKALRGECGSSNEQPVASFGIGSSGETFSCSWATVLNPTGNLVPPSTPIYAEAPVATVYCAKP